MPKTEHEKRLYKKKRIRFLNRKLKQKKKHLIINQNKIDKIEIELEELKETL